MLKLIIEDDEGRKTVVPFVREEITIGRQEGNTIRLTERNVSRRHARLLRQNGRVVVEDLGSSNGTRINGERISGQSAIKDGDLLQIGDYDLALQNEAALAASKASPSTSASTRPTLPATPALRAGSDEPSDPGTEAETELEAPVGETSGPAAGADGRRHSTSIIRMDQVEATRSRKVEELDAAQAPRLVVVSSELKGQEFSCLRTEMRVGRTADNDIVIDHRSLSRTHAKIVREDNGEWRVIDMQSANGMTINGESYAQATLNAGDIIELGHVKLRFVGPGELAAAKGSGKGLYLVAALVVLAVVGGGAFFLFAGTPDTPPAPPVITERPTPTPEKNEPPPAQEEPPPEPEKNGQAAVPPEPKPTPVVPPAPPPGPTPAELAQQKLAALVQEAQQALNAGNLDKAEDTLGKTRKDGKLPPEAQQVAAALEAERKADRAIRDGNTALRNKKFDEVDRQLALAEYTTAFAKNRDDLATALAKAREAQAKTEPKVPVLAGKPAAGPSTPNAQEQARAAYDDAVKLFKARQIGPAIEQGKKCVELDSSNGECHMVLGAAYATQKDMTTAAEHYRQFLKLAPDHKQAPKVKKSLEEYESQQTPKQ
ncbi:FHA domain-containing protein [Stigmatella hybrida]|uniref:FHA domain-containing protein n=1 Tax=Stigmatella hybrida TaxID=394097 RepID=UPI001CDAC306|nr:FHA domain-containing protein [Stigmatella hybrida]